MLDVPGARLFCEVQGFGPTLLLFGHPMGASGFAPIAPLLAEFFTVVTYDLRGFARSTIDNSEQDAEPDLLADDARQVLEAVGTLPAHVFGSSGGAVTGLALVARHPDHVETLIAHEPPLALLLPDAEEARAGIHQIYETYRNSGITAAWETFSSFTGMNAVRRDDGVDPQPPSAEEVVTSERFFAHGFVPIALYQPDITALREAPGRLVVAGGTASEGQFAHRTAVALAGCLGTPLNRYPGGPYRFRQRAERMCRRPPPHLDVALQGQAATPRRRSGAGLSSARGTRSLSFAS
jgi:clorobiocin biosynthesis protein CloN7